MFQHLMIKRDRCSKFYSSEEGVLKNKIVLVLMQLKGISRKIILKRFVLSPDMTVTLLLLDQLSEKQRLKMGG